MKFPVYIAAPKAEQARALRMSEALRAVDCEVVSTWHDTLVPGVSDPDDGAEAARILGVNRVDLGRASAVVALLSEDAGRETYVEIGRALERNVPVVMVAERGGLPLSKGDAFAVVVADDLAAVARVVEWAHRAITAG